MIATDFEEWRETGKDGDDRLKVQAVNYGGFYDTSSANHPAMGVRVFEAGLDNFNSAKEKALNQKRRESRSARRVHARRNARRKALRKLLAKHNFLPSDDNERERLLVATDDTGQLLLNPYKLRAEGLDRKLEPFELGRALYHFAQRRGFKSNRKSGKEQDDEGMLAEIKALGQDIEKAGTRTLGEFLWKLGWGEDGQSEILRKGQLRLRCRHTRRNMYQNEVELLLNKQEEFYPELAQIRGDESTPNTIVHSIFFQHPFELTDERRERAPSRANLHRAPQTKPCPLERGEYGCPKSAWIAQRFRMLKEVCNLQIIPRLGDGLDWKQKRFLSKEERNHLVTFMSKQKSNSFSSIASELAKNFGTNKKAFFNLQKGGREGLDGNFIDATLAGLVGKKVWSNLQHEQQQLLRTSILNEEDPEALVAAFSEYGLDEKKEKTLKKFNPDQTSGYLSFSAKAMERLVPILENGEPGEGEYEALVKAYPDRPVANAFTRTYKDGSVVPALPYLQHPDLPHELKDITNPLVRRALGEIRKVVNAVVREHGLPGQIVVELARDIKMGPKQRKEVSKRNNLNRKRKEECRTQVQSILGSERAPLFADVQQYMLWCEQDKCCLYSGKAIPQSALFSGALDVDHILPHWQSLDDSQVNKVLCYREENAAKGQRLPIDWLGANGKKYEALLSRTMDLVEKNNTGLRKRFEAIDKWGVSILERAKFYADNIPGPWSQRLRRILLEEIDTDGFSSRQLNDTRYISRSAIRFLELLYHPERRTGEKAVRATRGGLTSELRWQWGINDLLKGDPLRNIKGEVISELDADGKKSRSDHRHHAIDAVVVALSSRSMLRKFQIHHKQRENIELSREDLVDLESGTFYGQLKDPHGVVVEGKYVTRKTLENLSGKDVRSIKDKGIQRIVNSRLIESGWDGKATALPKDWWQTELISPAGLPIRKVRVVLQKDPSKMITLGDKQHRYAVKGNNHHTVFVEIPGKTGPEIRVAVLPKVEAANRVRRNATKAVQDLWPEDGKFLFSLSRKESIIIRSDDRETLCLLQKQSGKFNLSTGCQIVFREHLDSRPAGTGNKSPFALLASGSAIKKAAPAKVTVDPIGRIFPAND